MTGSANKRQDDEPPSPKKGIGLPRSSFEPTSSACPPAPPENKVERGQRKNQDVALFVTLRFNIVIWGKGVRVCAAQYLFLEKRVRNPRDIVKHTLLPVQPRILDRGSYGVRKDPSSCPSQFIERISL